MSDQINIFSQFTSWYKTILRLGFVLGFLVVSYYFLSIGYFPANDLTTFVAVLLYEALLSFIALGSIFFVLFLAPYFWIKTVLGKVKTCDWIVGRDSLDIICYIANKEDTKDKKIAASAYARIFTIYTTLTLIYISILSYCFWHKYHKPLFILVITGIICFYISCLIFPGLKNKPIDNLNEAIESQKKLVRIPFWNIRLNLINLISTIIASIVSGLCLFIGIIFIYFLISPIKDDFFKCILILLIIALSGMCLIINEQLQNLKTSICISVMVIIVALLPLAIDNLEVTNMRKSTLGSFDATLEIDTIACSMLSQQGFEIACDKQKPSISASNIYVLWRGSEYYLRFEDKTKKIHYLIIPANHIFGLSFKNNNDKDEKKS